MPLSPGSMPSSAALMAQCKASLALSMLLLVKVRAAAWGCAASVQSYFFLPALDNTTTIGLRFATLHLLTAALLLLLLCRRST